MITIIPAIDIIGGECVRLTRGDYAQKSVYHKDPVDVAQKYADAGIGRLHLVDLDGAKAFEPRNLRVLEQVARRTGLDIQWGGGIKSTSSLASVLDAGARRAIVGSIAATKPELFEEWLAEFGSCRIILGADVRDGLVATHGWLQSSDITAEALIRRFAEPERDTSSETSASAERIYGTERLSQAIVTEISRDGMLSGPAFELYAALQAEFPTVDITASGGISTIDDIRRLDAAGTRSVIVGKALYENKITLEELKPWL